MIIGTLAAVAVLLSGLYLVGLAAASFFAPAFATRFLLGFAGSAPAHYLELLLRLIAGCAFVLHGQGMLFPGVFVVLGWVLVVTTAGLLAVPWRWHRRFAARSVPHAIRHLVPLGVASLALGGIILVAAIRGSA